MIYFNNTSRKGGWSTCSELGGNVAKYNNQKITLCIWWDGHGIIYKEYLEKGKTLDSKVYSEMHVHVDTAMKEKCQTKFQRKNSNVPSR